MPLGLDQGVGCVVSSPLGAGCLTGKIHRGKPLPEVSPLCKKKNAEMGRPVSNELLYKVVDAADEIAKETGKKVAQIALNWLL